MDALPPVLVLADHLGFPGGVAHGVSRYLIDVLPGLKRHGVEVHACFLRGPHPLGAQLEARGVQPVFLDARRWSPWVLGSLVRLARRRGAGLVHATGFKGTLLGRLAARRIGAGVLVHLHDLNEPGSAVAALQRAAARERDLGVCVSAAAQELAVRGYHLAPGRVRVLHNGVRIAPARDPAQRAAVRRELGLDAEQPVVAVIARLHPVKGQGDLLDSLPLLLGAARERQLLFIGDGPDRARCEARVVELGLAEQVRFLGQRDDIEQLLGAVDLVLVPSRSEGFGLAAAEALAAGVPVVAHATGGLVEVVRDGVDGRLVAPGDTAGLAQATAALLADPRERARLAVGARQGAARFALESHLAGLIACYREALA